MELLRRIIADFLCTCGSGYPNPGPVYLYSLLYRWFLPRIAPFHVFCTRFCSVKKLRKNSRTKKRAPFRPVVWRGWSWRDPKHQVLLLTILETPRNTVISVCPQRYKGEPQLKVSYPKMSTAEVGCSEQPGVVGLKPVISFALKPSGVLGFFGWWFEGLKSTGLFIVTKLPNSMIWWWPPGETQKWLSKSKPRKFPVVKLGFPNRWMDNHGKCD